MTEKSAAFKELTSIETVIAQTHVPPAIGPVSVHENVLPTHRPSY